MILGLASSSGDSHRIVQRAKQKKARSIFFSERTEKALAAVPVRVKNK